MTIVRVINNGQVVNQLQIAPAAGKNNQGQVIDAANGQQYLVSDEQTNLAAQNVQSTCDGKDLWIAFEGGDIEHPDLIIKNYYDYNYDALVGQNADGQFQAYELGCLAPHALAGATAGAVGSANWVPAVLGGIAAIGLIAAAAGSGGGNDEPKGHELKVSENPDGSGDILVEVTGAEPNATLELTVPAVDENGQPVMDADGKPVLTILGRVTTDADGRAKFPLKNDGTAADEDPNNPNLGSFAPEEQEQGFIIPSGEFKTTNTENPDDTGSAKYEDKTPPAFELNNNSITTQNPENPDKYEVNLGGTGEPGAKVNVNDKDGNPVKDINGNPLEATVDDQGNWAVSGTIEGNKENPDQTPVLKLNSTDINDNNSADAPVKDNEGNPVTDDSGNPVTAGDVTTDGSNDNAPAPVITVTPTQDDPNTKEQEAGTDVALENFDGPTATVTLPDNSKLEGPIDPQTGGFDPTKPVTHTKPDGTTEELTPNKDGVVHVPEDMPAGITSAIDDSNNQAEVSTKDQTPPETPVISKVELTTTQPTDKPDSIVNANEKNQPVTLKVSLEKEPEGEVSFTVHGKQVPVENVKPNPSNPKEFDLTVKLNDLGDKSLLEEGKDKKLDVEATDTKANGKSASDAKPANYVVDTNVNEPKINFDLDGNLFVSVLDNDGNVVDDLDKIQLCDEKGNPIKDKDGKPVTVDKADLIEDPNNPGTYAIPSDDPVLENIPSDTPVTAKAVDEAGNISDRSDPALENKNLFKLTVKDTDLTSKNKGIEQTSEKYEDLLSNDNLVSVLAGDSEIPDGEYQLVYKINDGTWEGFTDNVKVQVKNGAIVKNARDILNISGDKHNGDRVLVKIINPNNNYEVVGELQYTLDTVSNDSVAAKYVFIDTLNEETKAVGQFETADKGEKVYKEGKEFTGNLPSNATYANNSLTFGEGYTDKAGNAIKNEIKVKAVDSANAASADYSEQTIVFAQDSAGALGNVAPSGQDLNFNFSANNDSFLCASLGGDENTSTNAVNVNTGAGDDLVVVEGSKTTTNSSGQTVAVSHAKVDLGAGDDIFIVNGAMSNNQDSEQVARIDGGAGDDSVYLTSNAIDWGYVLSNFEHIVIGDAGDYNSGVDSASVSLFLSTPMLDKYFTESSLADNSLEISGKGRVSTASLTESGTQDKDGYKHYEYTVSNTEDKFDIYIANDLI